MRAPIDGKSRLLEDQDVCQCFRWCFSFFDVMNVYYGYLFVVCTRTRVHHRAVDIIYVHLCRSYESYKGNTNRKNKGSSRSCIVSEAEGSRVIIEGK